MNKFTVISDFNEMSCQIAMLLNTYNRLLKVHTTLTIINSSTAYTVKYSTLNNENIISGCIGIKKLTNDISLIRHLCVHEAFRRQGIAFSLINTALKQIVTEYVHMKVRCDNLPSLTLAEKVGFLTITGNKINDYYILTVGKKINEAKR